MGSSHSAGIRVTRDLGPILEKLGVRFYKRVKERPFESEIEVQKWIRNNLRAILSPIEIDSAYIRYIEPKMNASISGTLGGKVYVDVPGRRSHARRKPSTRYKETPKRKQQTNRMKEALAVWKKLDDSIKEQWIKKEISDTVFGDNLFRGVYLSLKSDGRPIPEPFVPTKRLLEYYKARQLTKE